MYLFTLGIKVGHLDVDMLTKPEKGRHFIIVSFSFAEMLLVNIVMGKKLVVMQVVFSQ